MQSLGLTIIHAMDAFACEAEYATYHRNGVAEEGLDEVLGDESDSNLQGRRPS